MLFSPFNFLSKYNLRKTGNTSTKWAGREYENMRGVVLGSCFVLGWMGVYLWPDAEIQGSTFKFLAAMFGFMMLSAFIGWLYLAVRLIYTRKYVKMGIPPREEEKGKG